MNFGFNLVELRCGTRASLYTVHLDGEAKSEYAKFRDDPALRSQPDHRMILQILHLIAERYGCRERMLKNEIRPGSSSHSLRALHYENESLRLYCCRWSHDIMILGNGGIKRTASYQQDPHLDRCVRCLEYVDKRITARLRSQDHGGDLKIVGSRFVGDLEFTREEIYG